MKSIRNQLIVWLVGGLLVLFAAGGIIIWSTIRSTLISRVDIQLELIAKEIARELVIDGMASRSGIVPPRRPIINTSQYWNEFNNPNGTLFFQYDPPLTEKTQRSISLGDFYFEPDEKNIRGEEKRYKTVAFRDGRQLRVLLFSGKTSEPPNSIRKPKTKPSIFVAKDLEEVYSTLSDVLLGILVGGVVLAAFSIALVILTLKRALSPLEQLGKAVSDVKVDNLSVRFDSTTMPVELQPIAERLNQLIERIERSFQRERQFSSDISHELRTPLSELKMMAEVAIEWPEERTEQKYHEILETVDQMEGMTNTLMALARLESGEQNLEKESISLGEFINEMIKPHRAAIKENGLKLRDELPENLSIETDRRMLYHIVSNLVSNAVEYTIPNGTISISPVRSAKDEPLGFAIKNSCNSLSSDDLSCAFDRFWRDDQARSDSGNHHGLGLPLVKLCAEAISYELNAYLEEDLVCFQLTKQP